MTLLARAAWPLQTGIQSKREPSVWQNFGEARAGRVRHKQAEACRRTPTKTIQNKASTASQAKPSQAQMGQRFSGHSLQADTHEVEKSRSNPAYPNAMINARCKFCRHKLYPNTRIPWLMELPCLTLGAGDGLCDGLGDGLSEGASKQSFHPFAVSLLSEVQERKSPATRATP